MLLNPLYALHKYISIVHLKTWINLNCKEVIELPQRLIKNGETLWLA